MSKLSLKTVQTWSHFGSNTVWTLYMRSPNTTQTESEHNPKSVLTESLWISGPITVWTLYIRSLNPVQTWCEQGFNWNLWNYVLNTVGTLYDRSHNMVWTKSQQSPKMVQTWISGCIWYRIIWPKCAQGKKWDPLRSTEIHFRRESEHSLNMVWTLYVRSLDRVLAWSEHSLNKKLWIFGLSGVITWSELILNRVHKMVWTWISGWIRYRII